MTARAGGVLLLVSSAVMVLGCVVALIHPEVRFAWGRNLVSDLGAVTCLDRGARWVCSPRHEFFNTCTVMAGVLLVLAAVAVCRWWGLLLSLGFGVLGSGLLILGIFPADLAPTPHLAGAVLALPVTGALMMVSGKRGLTRWSVSTRRVRFTTGLLVLMVSAGNLLPVSGFPKGPAEYIGFVSVLLVTVVEGWRLARGLPSSYAGPVHPPSLRNWGHN